MISTDTHHPHRPPITSPSSSQEPSYEPRVASVEKRRPPIIGLPIAVSPSDQGPLLQADAAGAWAIERMGGRILLLPVWPFPTHANRYQSLWPLMQSMDGLFLPSGIPGTDWSAHWKQRESQPGPATWTLSWEIALAQLASSLGMPILAVAEGAEKWNVALGGRVNEHVHDPLPDVPVPMEQWEHQTIRVRANSKLATTLLPTLAEGASEQQAWTLPFMPQQGVETVAPGLRTCAQSEQTAIVAFERTDTAFGLGIMGRLDWGLDQIYGTTIVDTFLHASQSFALARQHNPAWEAARETICSTLAQRVMHGLPVLAVPQTTPTSASQRSGASSSITRATGPHERFRQRSQQPTKEELNLLRRQRLKASTKETRYPV